MKRLLFLMLTGLLATIMLVACGDEEDSNNNSEATETEDNSEQAEEEPEEDVETEEENEEVDENASEEEDTDSNNASFEVTEDAQTDLRIGDTGTVQTSIGTYELTVNSAEIVGTELDGEVALLDEIILLELTFKNVGDEPLNAEDIMINLGLVTDLESTDQTNAAAAFDSVENFEGEIAPGEERDAQFIADTRTAEEYYFRTSPGAVAAGTHNDVMWTITDEEARSE